MQCVRSILVRQRGAIYTWLVVFLPVFILIFGFLVDIGMVYALQNRVQTALDISATSALAASVKVDSLRVAEAEVTVDTNLARQYFTDLLLTNLKGRERAGVIQIPNGEMQLQQIRLRETGPPSLYAEYQVKYETLLLNKVSQPNFVLHTDTVLTR